MPFAIFRRVAGVPLDPVWDFAEVPLDVVPRLLAGHREGAPLPDSPISVDIAQIRRFARRSGLEP